MNCSSSNERRANRNARLKSQWDRDAEQSIVNRKGTRKLSRECEMRRSQRGSANEIETRVNESKMRQDEMKREARERERGKETGLRARARELSCC